MPELSTLEPIGPFQEVYEVHRVPPAVLSFNERADQLLYVPAICSLFALTPLLAAPFSITDVKERTHRARVILGKNHPEQKEDAGAHYDANVEYTLGTGVSSSVWLLTDWVVTMEWDSEKPVTRFERKEYTAVKRYNIDFDTINGDEAATKKALGLMKQELQALQHPRLRECENICQLVFTGWENDNPTPSLGLEFAQFGTLDDCLQDIRSYSSSERKCHLTFDIAFGLAAIHSAGLVHGDFKTRNILVTTHPTRRVVAKITDLTGVAPAATYGASGFAFSTPKWQAPEAFLRKGSVDWQLADVYSLGMVVATMWSTTGYIPPGGSFFDAHVQYDLQKDDTILAIQAVKLADDEMEGSLLKLALSSVNFYGPLELPLKDIIEATLAGQPSDRARLLDLIQNHMLFRARIRAREVLLETTASTTVHQPTDTPGQIIPTTFTISNLTTQLRDTIFEPALAAGQRAARTVIVADRPDLSDHSLDERELLSLILVLQHKWSSEDEKLTARQKSAASLFEFLGCEYASRANNARSENSNASIVWLSMAAGMGLESARLMLCLTADSNDFQFPKNARRGICVKFWSALFMVRGDLEFGGYLERTDPALHQKVIACANNWRWQCENNMFIEELRKLGSARKPYAERADQGLFVDMASPSDCLYGSDQCTALHLAAAAGDLCSVCFLVKERGVNVDVTNAKGETALYLAMQNGETIIVVWLLVEASARTHHITTAGVTIMHALTFMDDTFAAVFAADVLKGGARLDRAAVKTDFKGLSVAKDGAGLPIHWAALRGKSQLFTQLVKLHTKAEDQRLSVMDYIVLLQVLVTFLQASMLGDAVASEHKLVDMNMTAQSSVASLQIFTLLKNVEDDLGFSAWFFSEHRQYSSPLLGPREFTRLLYGCIDPMMNKYIRRLHTHRRNLRGVRNCTIQWLLERADLKSTLLSWQGTDNPLYRATKTSDTEALMLFMNAMRCTQSQISLMANRPELFGAHTALVCAINNRALEMVKIWLQMCPDLAIVSSAGNIQMPLHLAAEQRDPAYVRVLLEHGVDPHLQNAYGVDAIVWALSKNPDTSAAKGIANTIFAAAETDILQPVSPSIKVNAPFSTLTAFGLLMTESKFQVDRIRHFSDTYGEPSYWADINETIPVFRVALSRKFSSNYTAMDSRRGPLIEFFLSMFPDKINSLDTDEEGITMAPLHLAVFGGSLPAVKVLLRHGADLDLETGGTGVITGHTALGLALNRQVRGPTMMCQPGRPTEPWKQEAHEIVLLLLKAGSKSLGTHADSLAYVRGGHKIGTQMLNPRVNPSHFLQGHFLLGVDMFTTSGLERYQKEIGNDSELARVYFDAVMDGYQFPQRAKKVRRSRQIASSIASTRAFNPWPKRMPWEWSNPSPESRDIQTHEFLDDKGLSKYLPQLQFDFLEEASTTGSITISPQLRDGWEMPTGLFQPNETQPPVSYLSELKEKVDMRRRDWLKQHQD